MNSDIKIGELAALLKVSIHQIRYFEEKGVLLPKYKDINGYRMYGIKEIYILSHILLLRKFNINASDIKKHRQRTFSEGIRFTYNIKRNGKTHNV